MTSPSTPEPESDTSPTEGSRRTRARERRAIRWGFLVSVVAHLIAVALYPVLLPEPAQERADARPETPELPAAAFEVIVTQEPDAVDPGIPEAPEDPPLVELDEEEPVELPAPEPLPAPDVEPDPAVEPPVVGEDPETEEEEARSIAERLRPGPADVRLWSDLLPDRGNLTDAERANLLLEGMIETFNDSVAVAAALRGRMQDWTYTDEDGRRWGLSPGQLHLGDFAIPLPFQFERPPGLANDFGRRDWEIAEILRGATAAQIRATWSQRAREIRERMEAERNRERGNGGG